MPDFIFEVNCNKNNIQTGEEWMQCVIKCEIIGLMILWYFDVKK